MAVNGQSRLAWGQFSQRVLFFLVSLAFFRYLWYKSILSATTDFFRLNDAWTNDFILGDVTELVNVFIGTAGNGHVFPGATLPHGMVKVGMDTDGRDAVGLFQFTTFNRAKIIT
jgi:hypothetical protein